MVQKMGIAFKTTWKLVFMGGCACQEKYMKFAHMYVRIHVLGNAISETVKPNIHRIHCIIA